jgi:hypothetical protein
MHRTAAIATATGVTTGQGNALDHTACFQVAVNAHRLSCAYKQTRIHIHVCVLDPLAKGGGGTRSGLVPLEYYGYRK